MRLIVQKYGGTSVGDAAKICNVARRLLETQRDGCRVVAVISAMAGVTDNLIKLAREVSPQPTPRELDLLLATGESAASALIAMAVNALGGRAVSLTGAEAGILTDRVHSKAKIANISPRQIHYLLNEDYIVVVAGFQGQTNEGETTTLGRGGSDLTAIAGAGSKVMQSRAVEFAKKFSVPFEVRSSLHDAAGTLAKEETANMEDVVVRGVSIDRKQAKLTVDDVCDEPGIAARIFSTISEANIVVDMIVQSVSEYGTTDLSFTIHENDLDLAKKLLTPIVAELRAAQLIAKSGVAKLSVVGIGMRSHSGVAAKFFDCLGRGGINIQLISTSEIKIAVVINEAEADQAARLAHEAFGLARLGPVVTAI